jgi:hypothetical protein
MWAINIRERMSTLSLSKRYISMKFFENTFLQKLNPYGQGPLTQDF